MRLFKAGKKLAELADKGLNLADQAIVDRDKVVEFKKTSRNLNMRRI
jgi:hypothetical protein